jgi:hypothetical protein
MGGFSIWHKIRRWIAERVFPEIFECITVRRSKMTILKEIEARLDARPLQRPDLYHHDAQLLIRAVRQLYSLLRNKASPDFPEWYGWFADQGISSDVLALLEADDD